MHCWGPLRGCAGREDVLTKGGLIGTRGPVGRGRRRLGMLVGDPAEERMRQLVLDYLLLVVRTEDDVPFQAGYDVEERPAAQIIKTTAVFLRKKLIS